MSDRRSAWAANGLALAMGLACAAWLVPPASLFPRHPLDAAAAGDLAQSIVGQRYFIADAWRWPLLVVPRLQAPDGVNIALTDSIPLAALVLKVMRDWLPPGFTVVRSWIALAFALQPVAAVFALRGFGQRRLVPAVAVSVFSLCMPTLLLRVVHPALCSHFLLLVALGLYGRLVSRPGSRWGYAAPVLLVTALLIHPYLLCMAAALLGAAAMTLLARGDSGWRRLAGMIALAYGLTGGVALALGYGGSSPSSDFGFYSMNLLAPLMPTRSWLFPAGPLDATGGQAGEGYQYLGAGVLALGVVAMFAGRNWARRLRRHAGLVLVCLGLAVFALSNRVFAGHILLLDVGDMPGLVRQFHASGRFFWPVAYVILVGSVVTVCSGMRGAWSMPVLLAAAALQVIDTTGLRQADYDSARTVTHWTIPRATLAPMLARASRLTVWPTMQCGASIDGDAPFMPLLLLASAANVETNSMYTAHSEGQPCDSAATLSAPWRPGEMRVILPPQSTRDWRLVPDARHLCQAAEALVVCAEPSVGATMANPPAGIELKRGVMLGMSSRSAADALAAGWEEPPGTDGTWSIGGTAHIIADLAPSGSAPARLTVRLSAIAPARGGVQHVTVLSARRVIAEWAVPDFGDSIWTAALPPGGLDDWLDVTFLIHDPVRPIDRGMNTDGRMLGIFLRGFEVD